MWRKRRRKEEREREREEGVIDFLFTYVYA